jgi:diguanylate cyclase (GGDEF)-like protein
VQPLVVAGVVHGLLVVADEAPVQHVPAVVDSLELLAAQTAASLGMALLLKDVSRRAERDDLTGLRNRMGFTSALTAALERGGDEATAVLLLDLDDFKHVNDSLGHQAGDRLLVAVAEHLRESLRDSDVACRLGGDEFVVVLPTADEAAAEAVGERLLDAVAEASGYEGRDLGVTGSVGIALTSQAGSTPEELLRAADLAMYLAKDRGKGRCELFRPEMQTAALRRMDLTRDLRRALREGLLHLAYQPVVDVRTGEVTAVEALCRWRDAARGDVPPSEFVPLAEETGDVVPLGEWVLREACAQLAEWDAAGARPDLAMCVNVSTRQLERPGLLDVLDECLDTGLDPSRLVLEITETALAGDGGTVQRALQEVRARGVHVAVDDFGTGYSSLARLRTAPVTRLKVDRSFVAEIGPGGGPAPIVDATVAMARGLGLSVVAEGVETADQLRHLRRLGCPEAQGFLLTRPLLPAAVLPLLHGDVPWGALFDTD